MKTPSNEKRYMVRIITTDGRLEHEIGVAVTDLVTGERAWYGPAGSSEKAHAWVAAQAERAA